MSSGFLRVSAALIALGAASAACAPVQTYSGFSAERNNVEIPDPQVGVDTRSTVQQRFGSPSTTAVLDQGDAWYYLSAVQERVAFYTPRITERQVMVVRFDGETVSGVDKYGMERGRVVAYNGATTPTRGRELGLLEQIFGNIGRGSPIGRADEEQGARRDRN